MLRVEVGERSYVLNTLSGLEKLRNFNGNKDASLCGTFKGNKTVIHGCQPIELAEAIRKRLDGASKLQRFLVYSDILRRLNDIEIAAATEYRLYQDYLEADSEEEIEETNEEIDKAEARYDEACFRLNSLWMSLIQ